MIEFALNFGLSFMRKLLSGFLLLIYLGTSTGLTLHTHYCMGRLAGWSLGLELPDVCGKCGMDKSDAKDKGCCRDEHHVLKTSVDQKSPGTSFALNPPLISPALPDFHSNPLYIRLQDLSTTNPVDWITPPLNSVAVYLRNRVFRI